MKTLDEMKKELEVKLLKAKTDLEIIVHMQESTNIRIAKANALVAEIDDLRTTISYMEI